MAEDRTQSKEAATAAMVDALHAQSAQLQAMVDAYADMGHAAAEILRSRAR